MRFLKRALPSASHTEVGSRLTTSSHASAAHPPQSNQFLHQLQATAVPAGMLQWEAHAEAERAKKIWNSYLYGQSANVAKAAVWWSMFGTLVISLMGTDGAVGATRMAFNCALIVASPLAGAVAERCNIRSLLNFTTLGRLTIWTVLVPLTWIFINNVLQMQHVFWVVFVFLMFFDGVQVAFENVVDIDSGGLDTLSMQYNLPLNDYIRNRFCSIHQMVFDLSFILFTPPVAFLLLELSRVVPTLDPPHKWLGLYSGAAALQIGVSVVFFVLSMLSLWWYIRGLPKTSAVLPSGDPYSDSQQLSAAERPEQATQPSYAQTIYADMSERMKDVADGFRMVLRERTLAWRLVFLALETALEDSMVSVVIPEVALHTVKIFAYEHDSAVANLWAVCILAVGKVGGLLSGLYMSSRWNPPMDHQRNSPYRILFWSVLLSSLSVSLFPLGRWLSDNSLVDPPVAGALAFLGSFLFFVFSTAPKIGFSTLLQSLVASQQVAGRVFGFVGTFVTIADAVIITLINFIFVVFGRKSQLTALCVVAAVYLAHGLLEAIVGPLLVLDSPSAGSSSRTIYFGGGAANNQSFPMASVVAPSSTNGVDNDTPSYAVG